MEKIELGIITFEDAKDWIKENYSEDRITKMFDEEVSSGNWIDKEQMEDEGYENEHDYYTDYGRGEAEGAVIEQVMSDLESKYKLDFDLYNSETNILKYITQEYMCLSNS